MCLFVVTQVNTTFVQWLFLYFSQRAFLSAHFSVFPSMIAYSPHLTPIKGSSSALVQTQSIQIMTGELLLYLLYFPSVVSEYVLHQSNCVVKFHRSWIQKWPIAGRKGPG